MLRTRGYQVTIVETYREFSKVFFEEPVVKFDLLIATNTSLQPIDIQTIVPDVKERYPHTCIMVLSGWYPEDFVDDLRQQGIDGFLPLPFEEDVLVKEISRLLSKPSS